MGLKQEFHIDNYRLGFYSGTHFPVLYDGRYTTQQEAKDKAEELGHNTRVFHVVQAITEVP